MVMVSIGCPSVFLLFGGEKNEKQLGRRLFITLDIGNGLLELVVLFEQSSAVSRDEVIKAVCKACHALAEVIKVARNAWEARRY